MPYTRLGDFLDDIEKIVQRLNVDKLDALSFYSVWQELNAGSEVREELGRLREAVHSMEEVVRKFEVVDESAGNDF